MVCCLCFFSRHLPALSLLCACVSVFVPASMFLRRSLQYKKGALEAPWMPYLQVCLVCVELFCVVCVGMQLSSLCCASGM